MKRTKLKPLGTLPEPIYPLASHSLLTFSSLQKTLNSDWKKHTTFFLIFLNLSTVPGNNKLTKYLNNEYMGQCGHRAPWKRWVVLDNHKIPTDKWRKGSVFPTFHYLLYYYCSAQFKNEILFSKQISQARWSTKLPLGGSTRLTMPLVSLKNINFHNPDVEPHN